MRVPTTGPVRNTEAIRRKTIGKVKGARGAAPSSHVRNIQDTASIMGIPPEDMTEKVQTAIITLMSEVDNMRQELELAHRQISMLEKLADQDSLIAISNRRAFVREMTRMISYSQRYGINSALIYLDLNDLKMINDVHGHKAGDAALTHLANTILSNLRDSDILGRLGGDEFGIILPKASKESAEIKATSLIETIKKNPLIWEGKTFNLKIAYGIHALLGTESADQALDKADQNMYAHKKELKKK